MAYQKSSADLQLGTANFGSGVIRVTGKYMGSGDAWFLLCLTLAFGMNWSVDSQVIKNEKKEVLFSELHSLLTSGLDFGRFFRLLIEGENDKGLKRLLESLYASVVRIHRFGRVFLLRALDCGVLRIGEETNRLGDMLLKQGEDLTRELEHKLK